MRRIQVFDSRGRIYHESTRGRRRSLKVLGSPGIHRVTVVGGRPEDRLAFEFQVVAHTKVQTASGSIGRLASMLVDKLKDPEHLLRWKIRGKPRLMFVGWGRDHVHTLKAGRYFFSDVTSGLDYWLETQEPNGMFWDCIHRNPCAPAPAWFGEALGAGFFKYEDSGAYVVRRIPVEADCEYLYGEGVRHAWQATGDDRWLLAALPKLERALRYMTSHPDRWSRSRRLVKRSFCMDSWDFANPHFCAGDHRCRHPGDAQFLFHGDNSGLYRFMLDLAWFHERLGNRRRARVLQGRAADFRKRANTALFFGNTYGHMIPESLPPAHVYRLVGDERKRMSLSLGYTLNRGLPNVKQSARILREYQRRRRKLEGESFAEWFSMDPPYNECQWPGVLSKRYPPGDYMNGAVSIVAAGELALAAFGCGEEAYGADILERVWALSKQDGGTLHDTYRRAPANLELPETRFCPLDLHAVVNRGIRHGARPGVVAWTAEGDNDMRNLPTGDQCFGAIRFRILEPEMHAGRCILHLAAGERAALPVNISPHSTKCLYFLHAASGRTRPDERSAEYHIDYADGSRESIDVRCGHEINGWWNPLSNPESKGGPHIDRTTTRVAWRGPNPVWKDVGIYMFGWNNPHPERTIRTIELVCIRGCLLVAAISSSNQPVAFEPRIRSHGLPASWGHASVFHAIASGIAGIIDKSAAFREIEISPRWESARCRDADVCLHYPASNAACAYRYRRTGRSIRIDVAGSFDRATIRVLLPAGRRCTRARYCGREWPFRTEKIRGSAYARLENIPGPGGALRLEMS